MTDHRDFHVVPEDYGSSCYGTEHSLKWGAARDLTISALRAYLVKRGKGSKYYAIVDGAVSLFLPITGPSAKWTLKQVQGDGTSFG